MNSFVCLICGYVAMGEEPPDTCPICDAPREMFEKQDQVTDLTGNNAFRCLNCEYVHEGNEPPEICPVCGFTKEHFEAVKNDDLDENNVEFENIVILGGGIAAISAIETLRSMNSDVKITMITGEEKLPYYRLNLTRFLCEDIDESDLCIHSQYWYDEKRIMVYKNRIVIDINREDNSVLLDNEVVVSYDRLIIALGSHSFVPPIKGASSEGIVSLRSIEDAKAIKSTAIEGSSAFVIGGGVLGLETAGALNKTGVKVTVGEGASWLMPRQLNDHASKVLDSYITSAGININYNFITREIKKLNQGFEISAQDGRVVKADMIIFATGVRPNTYLARKANLEVNVGIVVNDQLLSSDPNIYAIGDISEHYGAVYGLWNIAQYQGKIAAMNLLGTKTSFGGVPRSNALKVLDIDVFSIGVFKSDDASYNCLEKSSDDQYILFMVRDGVVVGSIAIGYKNITHKIKKLVESQQNFSQQQLGSVEDILNIID